MNIRQYLLWLATGDIPAEPAPPPPPRPADPELLAQELLLSLLTRGEKRQFARDGWLDVKTRSRWWWGSRRAYRIIPGLSRFGWTSECELYRRILIFRQHGCVHVYRSLPRSDFITALYLALKANEPYVRQTTNWF